MALNSRPTLSGLPQLAAAQPLIMSTSIRNPMLLFVVLLALLVGTPANNIQAQQPCRSFPETGYQVCGRLLEYWQQNGGISVFGYPIGDQFMQAIEGRQIQVQLFERNRLELHSEQAPPYDVLLGRLGADALQRANRDWRDFPRASASEPHYFRQTGHAIAPQFWGYWSSHGLEFDQKPGTSLEESLALFGLPLSEAAIETNPTDGNQYLTQHFERVRFEYHPENAGTPYEVLLGLLGQEQTGSTPVSAPPAFAVEVIGLVNQERAAVGCPALAPNDTLMQIAQAHSQDMANHDFFDHAGADGRSPFQRMRDAGYRYARAAENLAAGVDSPAKAVELWMQSPGHRANILNCQLRETGIGYVVDPHDPLDYGAYWTQDFGVR
jgi:uncharacterized protein YkwD